MAELGEHFFAFDRQCRIVYNLLFLALETVIVAIIYIFRWKEIQSLNFTQLFRNVARLFWKFSLMQIRIPLLYDRVGEWPS